MHIEFYQHQEYLLRLSNAHDWETLENHFESVCSEHAGKKWSSTIQEISMRTYAKKLAVGLARAVSIAECLAGEVILFNFSFDNNWRSNFIIHSEYDPRLQAIAVDSTLMDHIEGPSFEPFGNIYLKNGGIFSGDVCVESITLFMIARTIALIGRIVAASPRHDCAVMAIAFEEDGIVRLCVPT